MSERLFVHKNSVGSTQKQYKFVSPVNWQNRCDIPSAYEVVKANVLANSCLHYLSADTERHHFPHRCKCATLYLAQTLVYSSCSSLCDGLLAFLKWFAGNSCLWFCVVITIHSYLSKKCEYSFWYECRFVESDDYLAHQSQTFLQVSPVWFLSVCALRPWWLNHDFRRFLDWTRVVMEHSWCVLYFVLANN